MLRITPNARVANAKGYYSNSDYYLGGQELAGLWHGKAAEQLGLSGEIKESDWHALCDGLNPNTGERLLQRQKKDRRIGYDCNFHSPKSLSLLYAATKDERLLNAFRDSVNETMNDIQAEMKTRVRMDGRDEDRVSGNAIWGEFVHFTARPERGVPDPHLHAHCFVFNTTFDKHENRWKAAQLGDIKADGKYFEAMFHSRLSRRLAELGLPIERTQKGWEIAGVSHSLQRKFSRRTIRIEARARKRGITDPVEKAELGAKTRSSKIKDLSMGELEAEWRRRMSPTEEHILDALGRRLGGSAAPADEGHAAKSMNYAIEHEFERRAVVPTRQILSTAMMQSYGLATPEQIANQLDREGLLLARHEGRDVATTNGTLAMEKQIVDYARSARGTVRPLVSGSWAPTLKLSASQRAAAEHVLGSRDGVCVVFGQAGTGKTTMMRQAVDAIELAGTQVQALAPTAEAAHDVLRSEGFDAQTVAMFLKDTRLQEQSKGKLLWVDEASLLGAKDAASLFSLADRLQCRIVLMGDDRQHAAVAQGTVLNLLVDEAGLQPACVKEIRRQSGEYKRAIKAMSDGKVADGLAIVDKLGWIVELPDDERYKQLAKDYVGHIRGGESCLIVCPTHKEGDRVAAELRQALRSERILRGEDRPFTILRNTQLTEAERSNPLNYRHGDVIQFHQNAKDFRRGQRLLVDGQALPLDQAKRFSVFRTGTLNLAQGDTIRITHNGYTADGKHRLINGSMHRVGGFDKDGNILLNNGWRVSKHFGHFNHGVVTSFASQGKTYSHVLVAQGNDSIPASSQQQFYVSCSRGRHSLRVYCESKKDLREAIGKSEQRVTATSIAAAERRRLDMARFWRFDRDHDPRPLERERQLVHER
jgi:conjugative relaxase-like TrwC/TraI family protein